LAAENIRDDLQHVVKTDVMQSPGMTSLGIMLAFTGGAGVRDVSIIIFRTWFGASDNPLVMFTWSLEASSADSWEIS
jgi:hypothetical protein